VRTTKITLTTGALFAFLAIRCFAVEPLVKIDRIETDRIFTAGIILEKGGDFTIKGVGMLARHSDEFIAYAWLLDSSTRKPIWIMDRQNTSRKGEEEIRQADDAINLKPGKYELYYYAGNNWLGEINIKGRDIFQLLGDLFSGRFDNGLEDNLDKFYVGIYPARDGFKDFTLFKPDGTFPDALIQFNKVGDSKYLQQGFKLDKPMSLHIYGMCEYPSGYKSPTDYARIINADTREKVWEMDRWDTEPAGGGSKNRVADTDIDFDKGSYILTYVTDDSHSWPDFNVMPPYDPFNWGVALLPAAKTDKNAFHLFTPKGRGDALVDLTRARDNDDLSQAFKIDKDMSLRVVCLGEWSGDFVDYGWIEDASTGRTVWELTYRNSEHAGGATKNRMFDGIVKLSRGAYVARYTTDGSHAYRDWNDSPPYDPEAWGLAIYPTGDFDKSKFHLIDEEQAEKSADVLVRMTRLGDNVRKREKFTLDRQTRIHIYAVGEGDPDEMFDYGWIINDRSGKSIWEMTYRNTEYAGGARKNRMFDDSIILDPGTYEVYFITDGSHAFNDWNSAKPRDPASWGITVSIEKNKTG
jgi:hypothetical protein